MQPREEILTRSQNAGELLSNILQRRLGTMMCTLIGTSCWHGPTPTPAETLKLSISNKMDETKPENSQLKGLLRRPKLVFENAIRNGLATDSPLILRSKSVS